MTLLADIRFALRYFARHKATTAIIVAVIALGAGANTLIFSLFQAQFTRPAPAVPDDPAHARLYVQERASRTASWQGRKFTGTELTALATRTEVFSSVAAWLREDVIITGGDSTGARNAVVHFVTPNYFPAIGVPVAPGRGLREGSFDVADLTAVISENDASALFGSPAAAVGRRVLVNEVPVEVVGVAPDRFQGTVRDSDEPALWIPLSARSDITGAPPRWFVEQEALLLMARMAPGATHERATAVTQQVVTGTLPDSAELVGMARLADVRHLGAIEPWNAGEEMLIAFTLVGALGILILLIGWMNVSSLMVAAAVARRQEIAVRLALGASRLRLIRQMLTESTIVSSIGAAIGALIAYWVLMAIMASEVDGVDLAPDLLTFAFVAGLALVTGVLFGLAPALHGTRGVAGALRDSGGGSSSRSRLQRGLVVAQIALSQPLLVALGIALTTVIVGYRPLDPRTSDRVVSATFRPLRDTTSASLGPQAVEALIPRIAARPEVVAVVPAAQGWDIRGVYAPDRVGGPAAAEAAPTIMHLEATAPGWFGVLDVPILLGRDVAWADTNATDRPVVIGVDLAQALWGEANPVGRRLYSPTLQDLGQDSIAMSVVGVYDSRVVVPGMVWEGVSATTNVPYRVYSAYGQRWQPNRLLIRTRGPAAQHLPALQRFVSAEAPSLPLSDIRTLEQLDEEAYRVTLQVAGFAAIAGAIALALASLGLYGVISLAVRQRKREIGIRIAVGAHPMQVARLFLRSGMRSAAIALAIGLPVSVAAMHVLISMGEMSVPGSSALVVGGAIAVLLLAVAAGATWIPARRAADVDPGMTLRAE